MRQSVALVTSMVIAILVSCGGVYAQAPPQQSPPAGGVQASVPKYRVLRSVSGSKGFQDGGRYVIEDPRTVFYIPDDKQVIVYFEWEGPTGHHRFEGLWKNPDGKVTVISDFEFDASDKRFGGYWALMLNPSMATGLWTLEARVDGEVTGAHTFQIIAAAAPAATQKEVHSVRSLADIYKILQAASVSIEKLNSSGERISRGTGFFIDGGKLLTAFQVIDGATSLRLILPDGRKLETKEVLAWNRWQDWAFLKIDAGNSASLMRAKDGAWAVGDRCFMLDAPSEGGRVILDGSILGREDRPKAGLRMSVSFDPTVGAIGSPVVNEYAEMIGVIGGSTMPGEGSLSTNTVILPRLSETSRGMLSTPLQVIPLIAPDRSTTPFSELVEKNEFVAPIIRDRFVRFGTLAKSVTKSGSLPSPVDERREFSRRDGQMVVYVNWDAKEKRKGMTNCRILDLDNRKVGDTKPMKISLSPNEMKASRWEYSLRQFPPGVYRVDVLIDNDVVWRAFFRMTE